MSVMSLGGCCLAFAGFALFIFSNESLGTWGRIVPYLVIYGVGRGTWENTNKAVIADLFADTPDLSTAAFASISFFNGLAGNYLDAHAHFYAAQIIPYFNVCKLLLLITFIIEPQVRSAIFHFRACLGWLWLDSFS